MTNNTLILEEKLHAHEVVVSTRVLSSPKEFIALGDHNEQDIAKAIELGFSDSECLQAEILFGQTSLEVIVSVESEITIFGEDIGWLDDNQDTYWEFQGIMTNQSLFDYLDSMPNRFKHFSNTGDLVSGAKFWQKHFKNKK